MLPAAPSPPVAELLRSTGLHRHFATYPDISAALASGFPSIVLAAANNVSA